MRRKALSLILVILVLAGICACALAAGDRYAPIPWAYVMKKMDWTADSYSYTVGSGDQKISVVRNGSDVKISGGDITNIRFVKNDLWDESNQDYYGWHTEPGTYTLSDVVIHGQWPLVEVWANDDDEYRIVLEESVRGVKVLKGGAESGFDINEPRDYEKTLCSTLNDGEGYDYEVVQGNFGLDVHVKKNASVEIVNHTVIRPLDGTSLCLYLEGPNTSFELTGTGSVNLCEPQRTRDLEVEEPTHMFICAYALEDIEHEGVRQLAEMLKKNVKLDMSQFKGGASKPRILFCHVRIGKDDPYLDLEFETEWKDVLTSASDLKKNEKQMQIVVDPVKDGGAAFLQTQMYWQAENKAVCFANLRTAGEGFYASRGKAQLYVPYPSGINADNADEYLFTIEYPTLSGTDVLSSKDGTIAVTPYGLQFSAERVMPFELVWRKAPSQETQEGEIAGNKDAFEDLPPVDAPTLVFPDGTVMDETVVLEYEESKAQGNGTVVYNVHLVGMDGKELNLPGECILCFPYPDGLNENSMRKYRIIIHHYGDTKTEVFKSEDGDIEFTPQGLCIQVDSFSPFVITWEESTAMENLPKTGDDSSILFYGALFVISVAMMPVLKKRAERV